MSECDYEKTALLLYSDYHPHGKEWLYADEDGWTIAHQYARLHSLPANFPHWAVTDNMGWSVAHQAAAARKLPKGFTEWGLVDHYGDTVLHIALRNGQLPDTLQPLLQYGETANHAGLTIFKEYEKFTERVQASMVVKT